MSYHKASGMTLIETILVLAIAASLVLLGISMYRSAETDKNYFFLRSNVDFLFQAMKGFYQYECDIALGPDGAIASGGKLTFNPTDGTAAGVPVEFKVNTVKNYIDFDWPRVAVVAASGAVDQVYFAQFNPTIASSNKQAYACSPYATGAQCSNPVPIPGSNILLWQSQVVVKMKDPAKTTYYLAKAGADCAVRTFSPGTVVDCSRGVSFGQSANYMVWQRMPSFASPDIKSPLWVSNPVLKEFKLQYTHDPMYELYNQSATPSLVYKYYYCGG